MVNEAFTEVIFVGLPGPTHNYGGLSSDNLASSTHRGQTSRPREAALQVVSLIRLMASLGVKTAILPPQLRPNLDLLKTKFPGEAADIIPQAARSDPALLETASSSSSMWVANAATLAPMIDSGDNKLHITTANLHTNLHRRIEAKDTLKTLKSIFAGVPDTILHPRLSAVDGFRDEGAANHMRLAPSHGEPGLHVFVYGTDGQPSDPATARQNLVACEEIRAQHHIGHSRAVFLKQNPAIIKQGVFHNDVIAVSNESVLLAHESAYANPGDLDRITKAYEAMAGKPLTTIIIKESELSVAEAVATYFFNSQLVTTKTGMALIAPQETQSLFGGKAYTLMQKIVADTTNPIKDIRIIDLRQSMNNGGGPACLRLRAVMSAAQLAALQTSVNVLANEPLLKEIEKIISAHYPETLNPQDLADPALYARAQAVQDALSKLMRI